MNRPIRLVYLKEYSDLIDLICPALSSLNLQVTALASDQASLEAIIDLKPNMIVMDLRRLDSPNWKIHWSIRESDSLGHLPILAITDRALKYDLIPGLRSTRADDYISYPFEPSAFLLAVQRLLDNIKIDAES